MRVSGLLVVISAMLFTAAQGTSLGIQVGRQSSHRFLYQQGQSLSEKQKQFEMLKSMALSTNPFFVRAIGESGQFEGNGTEGIDPGE